MSKGSGGSGKGGAGKGGGANGRSANSVTSAEHLNTANNTNKTSDTPKQTREEQSTPASMTLWMANYTRSTSVAQLERLELSKLKALAKERGIVPTGNLRKKNTWAEALVDK